MTEHLRKMQQILDAVRPAVMNCLQEADFDHEKAREEFHRRIDTIPKQGDDENIRKGLRLAFEVVIKEVPAEAATSGEREENDPTPSYHESGAVVNA